MSDLWFLSFPPDDGEVQYLKVGYYCLVLHLLQLIVY
jgi:hypothetical protein